MSLKIKKTTEAFALSVVCIYPDQIQLTLTSQFPVRDSTPPAIRDDSPVTVLHLFNADPTTGGEIRSVISANSPFIRFLRTLAPPAGYSWSSLLYLTLFSEALMI